MNRNDFISGKVAKEKMINWGIVGTGHVASKFADTVYQMKDETKVYAVASRSAQRAHDFAVLHHVEVSYDQYEQMLTDPQVDAVYIAVPNHLHCAYAVAAMEAGKHVLCEKPMGMNAEQTQHMIDVAYDHNVFLMENMVPRFLPITHEVREWVNEGDIGEVRFIEGHFGIAAQGYPDSRWFNKDLGGGALLDVGIYPISYATMILGYDVEKVQTMAYIGETGVDEHHSVTLSYRGGRRLASLSASVVANSGSGIIISGEYGKIVVDGFTNAHKATLEKNFEAPVKVRVPNEINGFEYVIREVLHCLEEKDLESPRLPWVVTLENMRLLDRVRGMWGLHYPCE